MTKDRRYDEREVGLILKRVAELHERGAEQADARSMTRTEIEQVVGELGISRALVARAVSDVSVQDLRNQPVWLLGGKTDVMFEEVVEGSIDDATFSRMLEVLRRSLGDPGTLKVEAGARIWAASSSTNRTIFFTVTEHEERTTLRLEEQMPVDARTTVGGGTIGGSLLGFFAAVPLKVLIAKSALMLAWGPAVLAGGLLGWYGGRALWKRRSRGREQQLRGAFGELVALASSGVAALPPADDDKTSI